MRIDGNAIASTIFDDLKQRVWELKEKNITPHLVIILVGNDPASEKYVGQKMKRADEVGMKATLIRYDKTVTTEELVEKIDELNNDLSVHGIIVQRPLPDHIDGKAIDHAVIKVKDVDGFLDDSPFSPPLAEAVLAILKNVLPQTGSNEGFSNWLKTKRIVVIGKGETAGGPVISLLRRNGIEPQIIDSKTNEPNAVAKTADILISAVGRRHMVTPEMIKKGVILISVGMSRGDDGKLHGDYEEEEIENIAAFYTPIPGGVGPVNVAMLLENVIQAAKV